MICRDMTYKDLLLANIDIQLESLEARRDAASNYVYNSNMQIEAELLDKQIEALKATRDQVRKS